MLHQGRYRLGIAEEFFSERGVRLWDKVSREVVESLSLEIFKALLHVFLVIYFR